MGFSNYRFGILEKCDRIVFSFGFCESTLSSLADRLILSLPTGDCDRSPKLGKLDFVMRALFNRLLLHYDKVMFDLSGYLVDLKKSQLFMLGIESNQAIAI
jgi:hypothetical protein